ncbi:hypothetical protein G9A89_013163 [Geosiphon pyriformis]|nr:hypothetical protein G9A89_013163 [Geosiphon pyriformis]
MNGLVKRFNKTLCKALAKISHENRQEWNLFIPSVLFAYQILKQNMTQFTLFELVYEKKATLLIEQVISLYPTETINEENFEATLYQKTYQLMKTLENNRRTAADNINHAQE